MDTWEMHEEKEEQLKKLLIYNLIHTQILWKYF